jgi:hypothetical protein
MLYSGEHRAGDDPGLLQLETERTRALIRLQGAYVLELVAGDYALLTSPGYNPCNPDEERPVYGRDALAPGATHTMSPVGKMLGQDDPQHGMSRRLNYDNVDLHSRDGVFVMMRAEEPSRTITHSKLFNLARTGLTFGDTLQNTSDTDTLYTSVGEHFYIPVPENEISQIKLLDSMDESTQVEVARQDGQLSTIRTFGNIADGLADSQAFYLPMPHNNSQFFSFADGRRMRVSAYRVASQNRTPETNKGLLLWHRPGTNTICAEPVAGVSISAGQFINNQLVLPPGGFVELRSSIHFNGISG